MEEDIKSKVCRICLACFNEDNSFVSLFLEYKGRLISDQINLIAKIEIKQDDGLPGNICSKCLLELETALNFKQKCEESNFVLLHNALVRPIGTEKFEVKKEIPLEPDFDYNFYGEGLDDDYEIVLKDEPNKTNCPLQNEEIVRKSRAIDLKLECHDCGGLFPSKCKLRVHWKKVHQSSYMVCERCKRQFKSFKAYHIHKKKNSKSCLAVTCVKLEGKGKSRVYHCKVCEYKSFRIKDVMSHLVCHTGERPYTCDICSKTFTQISSLDSHKESVHKKYKIEGTCHVCGKYIMGRTKLYRHLRMHQETTVSCDVCKKIFKNKKTLSQHMLRHGDIKSYSCEICGSRFYTIADLANHKRTTHFKEKKYKCDICNYMAFRNATIKKHKAKHSATNIPCLICGAFVETEEEYLVHQKRHTVKPFSCDSCDQTFCSKRTMYHHMLKKHSLSYHVNKKMTKVKVKTEEPVITAYQEAHVISLSPTIIE